LGALCDLCGEISVPRYTYLDRPGGSHMLLDLGRVLTFFLSIFSLLALVASITRVVFAACISFFSGILFSHSSRPAEPLSRTLPVRILLWTLLAVIVLFALAWLLDLYYVPLLWRNQPYVF